MRLLVACPVMLKILAHCLTTVFRVIVISNKLSYCIEIA